MVRLAIGERFLMIAEKLRRVKPSSIWFADYFERTTIGSEWNTSGVASASIVSGQLVTEGNTYAFYTNVGVKYTGSLGLTGDFEITVDYDYVARTGDLARMVVILFDSSDNALAFGGMHDAQAEQNPGFLCGITGGDSWFSGYHTRDASGNCVVVIKRTGSTLYVYEGTTQRVSDTMETTVDYIVLGNERKNTYPGKTVKWNYVIVRG